MTTFTRRELEIINDMATIAAAATWGVGDYRNWSEARERAFDSLRRKVWELAREAPDDGGENPMLKMGVEDLPISVRPWNCLKHADIQTVGELIQWTRRDLLHLKNFGAGSLAEIERELARLGLRLADEHPAVTVPAQNDGDPALCR